MERGKVSLVPFDLTYGQLLLAAAAANLAAALFQLVLTLLRARRARKNAVLLRVPDVSVRVELRIEADRALEP